MKTVSVVVPVYYNEGSLPPLFEELKKVEAKLHSGTELELVFVDDGSGDQSVAELMKIKRHRPETKVVKLTRNFGAVHSCKVGLNYVTSDCVMWLSADLQDPPELMIEMTDQWLAGSKFVTAAGKPGRSTADEIVRRNISLAGQENDQQGLPERRHLTYC